MKWPSSITLVRHGRSVYNELRDKKLKDPEYREFCKEYERGPSEKLRVMARAMQHKFALRMGDYETPLSTTGEKQVEIIGKKLQAQINRGQNESIIVRPDVIFVSPHERTRQTLDGMIRRGFDVCDVRIVSEDRIREQEHGLALLYSDWRVFQSLHPEQRELNELVGPYWYQYPQGESVSMVRDRIRSFTNTLIREYSERHVMVITHHLTILSIRANYERLTPEEFIQLDKEQKPINCGVTMYRGNPKFGPDGKLELLFYNKKLY